MINCVPKAAMSDVTLLACKGSEVPLSLAGLDHNFESRCITNEVPILSPGLS